MQDLSILPIPNQEFSSVLGGRRVGVVLKVARNTMVADVTLDDVPLIRGVRLVAGEPVIPYQHLSTWGNLVLFTEAGELPWWESFGVTQSLVYVSPDEIEAVRND